LAHLQQEREFHKSRGSYKGDGKMASYEESLNSGSLRQHVFVSSISGSQPVEPYRAVQISRDRVHLVGAPGMVVRNMGDQIRLQSATGEAGCQGVMRVAERHVEPDGRVRLILEPALATDAVERRARARVPAKLPVQLLPKGESEWFKVSTADASTEGLRVLSRRQLASGTEIELRIDLSEETSINCAGRIVWDRFIPDGRYELGLVFQRLPAAQKECLTHFLLRRMLEGR